MKKKEYRYTKDRPALLDRMKRIEGQARGIQRMIEEDRYCIEIVQQLTALSGAADEVLLLILQDHMQGCVSEAIKSEDGAHHIDELMDTLRKVIKR